MSDEPKPKWSDRDWRDSPLIKLLAARLRVIRESRSMRLLDVAEATGMNYNFIGQIERGLKRPSIDHLEAFANGLGVTPSQLLGDITAASGLSSHEAVVVMAIRELDSESAIRAVLDALEEARAAQKRNSHDSSD